MFSGVQIIFIYESAQALYAYAIPNVLRFSFVKNRQRIYDIDTVIIYSV